MSETVARRVCGVICVGLATAISIVFVSIALAAAGLCVGCVLGLVRAF